MTITLKELSGFMVNFINQHLLPLLPNSAPQTLSLCQQLTQRLRNIEHTHLYQLNDLLNDTHHPSKSPKQSPYLPIKPSQTSQSTQEPIAKTLGSFFELKEQKYSPYHTRDNNHTTNGFFSNARDKPEETKNSSYNKFSSSAEGFEKVTLPKKEKDKPQ